MKVELILDLHRGNEKKYLLEFPSLSKDKMRCVYFQLDFSPKVPWTKAETCIEHVGANLKGPRSAVNRTNLLKRRKLSQAGQSP